MHSRATRNRVYEPVAVHTMGCAFDDAIEGLSPDSRQQPHMLEELAHCILRLFDNGETETLRLSRRALTIVTHSNRWHVGNRRFAISVLFPSDTDRRHVAV